MSILYLILSAELNEDGETIQKILKIGYTSERNKKRRFKAYELHNPGCKLLSTIKGTRKDETALHEYFKDLHWRGEWFRYDAKIVEYFKVRESSKFNMPKPEIKEGKVYWNDMKEVNLWLMSKYGIKENYIKELFSFPDPTAFRPDSFVDSGIYDSCIELVETIFKVFDDRKAKSLGCLRDVKNKVQSLIFSKGKTFNQAVSETNKSLLGVS